MKSLLKAIFAPILLPGYVVLFGIGCVATTVYLSVTLLALQNDHQNLQQEKQGVTQSLATLQNDLELYTASTTATLAIKDATIDELGERLDLTEEELDDTEKDLRKEKNKNDEFEDQIKQISNTVGDLDKLSKTDKELLQKYSKVSFLNEHYVPESIKEIDNQWKYSEDKPNQLHSNVMPFFEEMLEDAKDDGIDLWVVSAYRSFSTQAQLKGAYLVTYGSGANAFSADQGFSEHQLGTTVDFTSSGLGGGLDGFGSSAAYQWLLDNAHKYGFIMSYPPNNSYYVFEPWHWRFVGTDLAKDLNKSGKFFYDLEQREIDAYLLNIFD